MEPILCRQSFIRLIKLSTIRSQQRWCHTFIQHMLQQSITICTNINITVVKQLHAAKMCVVNKLTAVTHVHQAECRLQMPYQAWEWVAPALDLEALVLDLEAQASEQEAQASEQEAQALHQDHSWVLGGNKAISIAGAF